MPDLPFGLIRIRKLLTRISSFGILVCLLLCVPAAAHSPSAVTLAFDQSAGLIAVTITHAVPNPEAHYIRNVEVRVNNVIAAYQEYSSQPTKDTFTYSYNVNARPGDTIRVTATCVLVGSAQQVYTVPEPIGFPAVTGSGVTTVGSTVAPILPTTAPAPSPTSAPAGLLPLLGAAVILLFRKK